jgi:hypothetical protein
MHNGLIDAFNELDDVAVETQKLLQALALVRSTPEMMSGTMGWLAVQGIASAVEKLYSGCERAMERIAKQIDGNPIEKDQSWHRAIILRMSHPYGAVRPPFLSPLTAASLDAMRSFRHRERNSYGSDLDYRLVLELADAAVLVPGMLKSELQTLSAFLERSSPKK